MAPEISIVSRKVAPQSEDRSAGIESCLKSSRRAMRELAWRITRNWDLAERAISQTCLELLEGRTREALFMRALKMNARDLLKVRGTERERFESLDTALLPQTSARAQLIAELEVEADQADFASRRPDDQDPLDILIEREEQEGLDRLLAEARRKSETERAYRWILRKKWARDLELVSGGEAALAPN